VSCNWLECPRRVTARVERKSETAGSPIVAMRDEEEIREQYEFLEEQLDSEDMNHEGIRKMFTYYKRALGWVLEEEHM
jgi:hypothetical protein